MNRLLVLLILFLFAISGQGQSFHIRFDDSEQTLKDETELAIVHETNTLIQEHFYIHNLSDHPIDITVLRNDSILPEGFQSMFCLHICYTPETIEATETLEIGDSIFFTVDLYPYDLTGEALIEYTVTSDPDMDTIQFFANFDVRPLGIVDHSNSRLTIYPNPAATSIQVMGNYKGSKELSVFDISGKLVAHFKLAENESHFDISNLKNGVYMIRLIYANGNIYSKKLLKK